MSVYAELITAVTPLGFRHAAQGESDSDFLGRLALAASALPDSEWLCLTAESVEWVNASAKRLNLGKTVYAPSGFREIPFDAEEREVPSDTPAEIIALDTPASTSSERLQGVDCPECEDGTAHTHEPKVGQLKTVDNQPVAAPVAQAVDAVPEVVHSLGKTDAIRALVMQHPDWTGPQLKEALDAAGIVTDGTKTIATVRSVTLATITVAKRLGKWVD